MIQITGPGPLRLAVLASGRGSNFVALCEAIKRGDLDAEIKILISNKREAPALKKAAAYHIEAVHIDPGEYPDLKAYEEAIVRKLTLWNIDIVVLAGYMRLVGQVLLEAYPYRIINIHPALLPAFPGLHAQRQALEYGVKYSGCTVHIVDQGTDTGPILMQAVVPVYQDDSEDSLSNRILAEEHRIYWQALQLFAQGRIHLEGRKVFIV